MKRTLLIFAALLALMLTQSCAERPTDCTLDRQWQLLEIERADGTVEYPSPRTYYSFYRDVAQITCPGEDPYSGNLTYVKNTSLTIEFPYATAAELTARTLPVPAGTDPDATGVIVSFGVGKITSDRMILTTAEGDTYKFRVF